ncbi:unnamed protein product [Pleuronectes platessa]|uniref:Uncharacterized protein n=1 Tax=Pleuronectes platessa TaxID=8262 RepID=A0A9N7Y7J4_PLEPL|nr:unnamed protein product [Pleuronectes platessa]
MPWLKPIAGEQCSPGARADDRDKWRCDSHAAAVWRRGQIKKCPVFFRRSPRLETVYSSYSLALLSASGSPRLRLLLLSLLLLFTPPTLSRSLPPPFPFLSHTHPLWVLCSIKRTSRRIPVLGKACGATWEQRVLAGKRNGKEGGMRKMERQKEMGGEIPAYGPHHTTPVTLALICLVAFSRSLSLPFALCSRSWFLFSTTVTHYRLDQGGEGRVEGAQEQATKSCKWETTRLEMCYMWKNFRNSFRDRNRFSQPERHRPKGTSRSNSISQSEMRSVLTCASESETGWRELYFDADSCTRGPLTQLAPGRSVKSRSLVERSERWRTSGEAELH